MKMYFLTFSKKHQFFMNFNVNQIVYSLVSFTRKSVGLKGAFILPEGNFFVHRSKEGRRGMFEKMAKPLHKVGTS